MADTAEELAEFAGCLWEPADLIEVRIVDRQKPGAASSRWTAAAELCDLATDLVGVNARRCDVYAGVNPRPEDGAKGDACITTTRASFVDFDGGISFDEASMRVDSLGLPLPTLIVFTGHGYHFHWRLSESADKAEWTELQKDLAAALGSDPKVCNAERIMRLPGFRNWKKDDGATAVIIESDPDRRFKLADLRAIVPIREQAPFPPPPAAPPNGNGRHRGNGASVVERARKYLEKMPPAISGQGGHNATFAAATALVWGFDLPMQEARDLLREYNQRCQPAWSEKELEHKLRQAADKPHSHPRGWLLNSNGNGHPVGKRAARTPPASTPPDEEGATADDGVSDDTGQSDEAIPSSMPPGDTIPLGERDLESGRLVLSPKKTWPTGQAYLQEFHRHPDGPTLVSYAGLFLRWTGSRWCEVEDDTVRANVLPWLHKAMRYILNRRTGQAMLVDFDANNMTLSGAMDAIRNCSHVPSTTPTGTWLPTPRWSIGSEAAAELLPCKSLLLHIPTGRTFPATPALFNVNGLEFDPDPRAPEPRAWLTFLSQLWPTDPDQIGTLQEWFGYALTADTSQQKMMLLIGPKRSGKGTVARMLRRLVGEGNICGPTTNNLAGPFGLQALLGKSLAIVSDARFAGENVAAAVERLLCISGEDALTVERKFLPAVTLKLPTRFMFLSNELPRFSDAAGALVGRFIMLIMTQSWYGREDTELERRLIPELPGILNWALAGWKRLHQRGRFVMPDAVETHLRQFEELASPITAFIRDKCEIGTGRRAYVDELFKAWGEWCKAQGRDHAGSINNFGRDLLAAQPQLIQKRNNVTGRFYEGISLECQNG